MILGNAIAILRLRSQNSLNILESNHTPHARGRSIQKQVQPKQRQPKQLKQLQAREPLEQQVLALGPMEVAMNHQESPMLMLKWAINLMS